MSQSKPLSLFFASVDVPRLRTRYAVFPLAAATLGAMLALGGAWGPSVPICALLACVALTVTGLDRTSLRRDPAVALFGVLLLMAAFQLMPLPAGLLRALDAASEEASRLAWRPWRMDRATSWRPLHRDPGTGLVDFVYLAGLAAAYLAAAHAARRDALEHLYHLCAASALLCSLITLAHVLSGQDKVYAFYAPSQAAPPLLSPLLNANHLAALTGVGAILWLGSALTVEKALSKAVNLSAAIMCGAICALTLSRGGVASAVGGVLLLLALDSRTDGEDRKPRRRPTAQTWLGVAAAAAIFAVGAWMSAATLTREYRDGGSSKLEIIRQAMGLLRGHELVGYGSGAVAVAGAASERLSPERTFLRAESLPVDLALNVGLVVAALALWFGVRALRRWLPPAGAPPTALAAWAGIVSLLAHDMVDFSLYLGATGYVAALLGGVLTGWHDRGWRRPLPRSESLWRVPPVLLLLLVAALGSTAWSSGLEAERDRVERSLRASSTFFTTPEARAAVARHPSDAYLPLLLGTYAVGDGSPEALRFVARAMELSPGWAQPRLLLARILSFGNRRSQCLSEIAAVLARTAAMPVPCAQAVLRLRPPPSREELDRVAPRNLSGVLFLQAIGQNPPDAEYGAMSDELLLARDPRFVLALQRRALGARQRGDLADAGVWCERIERAAPTESTGPVCRADVLAARGDVDGALRVTERALVRVHDRYPLHEARTRLFARQRDTAAMRREAASMLEAAGADIERIVRAHGLRGELEVAVGNDRGAWAAYEMAHSLAIPDQPYALEMSLIASRLGDRQSLDQLCAMLLEQHPIDPRAARLCQPGVARVRPRPEGGVNPSDAGSNPAD